MCSEIIKMENRQFILDFIRIYREHPVLWRVNDADYMKKEPKTAAYEILLTKYQQRYPSATVDDVKKKLNSLRTNFRKECKKIADSERYGTGTEGLYVTNLWYFEEMSFLRGQEPPISPFALGVSTTYSENEQNPTDNAHHAFANGPARKRKRPVKSATDHLEEILSMACNHLSQPEDEFLQLAKTWSMDISKMEKQQQIFAKKAIAEILFEGQMGTLHRHSILINPTPQIHMK